MTTLVPGVAVEAESKAPAFLHSRFWDRWFVAGGAWLVLIPVLAFYLFRSLGAGVSAAEDLVTLLVMVPLGGPHVFATYTRTYLNPGFRRQEPVLWWLGLCVPAIVISAAVTSAFFDVTIAGSPPIRYLLTFFFFWAGVHIVHQHIFVARAYEPVRAGAADAEGAGKNASQVWGLVDIAVIALAMYPASFFRMSMVHPSNPSGHAANPDALATEIVTAVTGSAAMADDYVFRIGRVAPLLPDFLTHSALWIVITAAFVVSLVLFAVKSLRERRAGTLVPQRFRLVVAMAFFGSAIPMLPNLDSAFQGLNAWHSFQYLGLAWLMNRRSHDKGEIESGFFARNMGAGGHWRFYRAAIVATLGAVAVLLGFAWLLQYASDGKFVLFGHDVPPVDADGNRLYRPGSILLAYYLVAFSALLVHYLHDGFFFCRKRYLRD
ncbi:MAG: hypothetical protein AB8H80_14555 [Planctomycetota bacterium]